MKVSKNIFVLILLLSLVIVVGATWLSFMGELSFVWVFICYLAIYAFIRYLGGDIFKGK